MRSFLPPLIIVLVFIVIIFIGQIVFNNTFNFPKVTYGVTFSSQYAKYLDLDWKQTYIKMLDELKVKNLRIPTYWETIEAEKGNLDFEEVDFMLAEALKREAKVILVVGGRQPRWPECHYPDWARNLKLEQRQEATLDFVKKVVERYKDNPAVNIWQVENEPFLPFFGQDCDNGDRKFLTKEINLVKSLSNKKIIISDSGELGFWVVPMQLSDIFGTTIYREVYNPVMGYFSYPVLPYLYNLKSQIVRDIFAPKNEKTIIIEFQAEPWLSDNKYKKDPNAQAQLFSLEEFKNYINFAHKTGFDENYLWGVEWWYWMENNGHPEYLDYAKTLFDR